MAVESKQARATRQAKEQARGAVSDRYLRRGKPGALLGPLVKEFTLPRGGETLLVRRLDLAGMARAGVWPGPITQAVRRMIIDGPVTPYQADAKAFTTTAIAVAKAACIVPPPALLEGAITASEILPEHCRPLFVDVDPADDQFVIVALDVTRGATPEAAADETARQVVDAEAQGCVMVFQPFDLVALMHHIMEQAPGADGRFRLGALLGLGRAPAGAGNGDADVAAAEA